MRPPLADSLDSGSKISKKELKQPNQKLPNRGDCGQTGEFAYEHFLGMGEGKSHGRMHKKQSRLPRGTRAKKKDQIGGWEKTTLLYHSSFNC